MPISSSLPSLNTSELPNHGVFLCLSTLCLIECLIRLWAVPSFAAIVYFRYRASSRATAISTHYPHTSLSVSSSVSVLPSVLSTAASSVSSLFSLLPLPSLLSQSKRHRLSQLAPYLCVPALLYLAYRRSLNNRVAELKELHSRCVSERVCESHCLCVGWAFCCVCGTFAQPC